MSHANRLKGAFAKDQGKSFASLLEKYPAVAEAIKDLEQKILESEKAYEESATFSYDLHCQYTDQMQEDGSFLGGKSHVPADAPDRVLKEQVVARQESFTNHAHAHSHAIGSVRNKVRGLSRENITTVKELLEELPSLADRITHNNNENVNYCQILNQCIDAAKSTVLPLENKVRESEMLAGALRTMPDELVKAQAVAESIRHLEHLVHDSKLWQELSNAAMRESKKPPKPVKKVKAARLSEAAIGQLTMLRNAAEAFDKIHNASQDSRFELEETYAEALSSQKGNQAGLAGRADLLDQYEKCSRQIWISIVYTMRNLSEKKENLSVDDIEQACRQFSNMPETLNTLGVVAQKIIDHVGSGTLLEKDADSEKQTLQDIKETMQKHRKNVSKLTDALKAFEVSVGASGGHISPAKKRC